MADGDQMGKVVDSIKAMQAARKPGHITAVLSAFQILERTNLPQSYIAGLRNEVLEMIGGGIPRETTHVYLAFFGLDDRAAFLKIGIAKNVRSRMSSIATGNPLPRLWTFAAPYACRADALRVEAALLRHMEPDNVHGEWIRVAGLSEQAAQAVVESLAEVAEDTYGAPAAWHTGGF